MIESPICSCGWDINIGRIADPGCLEHKTWNTGCPRCEALKAKLRVAEEALTRITDGRADEWFNWQEIAEQALKGLEEE